MAFASEPKDLVGLCEAILPFPPGCYWADGQFVRYADAAHVDQFAMVDEETACVRLRDLLIEGVKKRLDADAPIGFLLSGGLDSSLVCAIAQRELGKPIRTFAIGMDVDAIDLKVRPAGGGVHRKRPHGGHHHQGGRAAGRCPRWWNCSPPTTITTIRASVGMYLVCKYIHEYTDVRVLLTGEVSDELFGYKYTDFAPSAAAFQREAEKRVRELHMYDVLRADRCISVNSLEARVPFGDLAFVRYAMSIDPALKMNRHGMGKYLLRKAFARDGLLPENILWRQKAAFSDAVGHSLVDDLKALAEATYTDAGSGGKVRPLRPRAPLYEGEPALPRAVRALLPRPEPHGGGLLDAQPRLARLRRGRPLRARAGKLRGQAACERRPRKNCQRRVPLAVAALSALFTRALPAA